MNRYTRRAPLSGIEPGDTVSLLMPTRPNYAAAWFGISQVGVVTLIDCQRCSNLYG
jgi:fatty-acyl-CoA synthase